MLRPRSSASAQLNASNAEISIPVTCEGGDLAGFNLVGNPYTNNISITDVKINGTAQTAFYRAEGGNNLMAYVADAEFHLTQVDDSVCTSDDKVDLSIHFFLSYFVVN